MIEEVEGEGDIETVDMELEVMEVVEVDMVTIMEVVETLDKVMVEIETLVTLEIIIQDRTIEKKMKPSYL